MSYNLTHFLVQVRDFSVSHYHGNRHVQSRGNSQDGARHDSSTISQGERSLGQGEGSFGQGEGSLGQGEGSFGQGEGSLGQGQGSLGQGEGAIHAVVIMQ